MNITWRIDQHAGLVYLKYSGATQYAYWSETMRSIFAHELYQPGFGFVAEIDGALVPDSAYLSQMLDFVERNADQFQGSRWANVTVNPAHYGMTRVAQARSQHFTSELASFTSLEEAAQWARKHAHAPMQSGEGATDQP